MKRLELSLLNNAVTFAEDALSNAVIAEEHTVRWKFAILSIVQAIELSLKELLKKQHPFLIYANVDKPGKTVSIEQAQNRLHKIAKIQLSNKDISALKTASGYRNKIVHHEIDAAIAELKLVFGRFFAFLNDFHRKYFDESLQDQIEEDLWFQGSKIKAYGEELYKKAKIRIEEEDLGDPNCVITCPECGWEALVAYGDNEQTCYVCGKFTDLAICKRCNKVMLYGEHEEQGDDFYCWDCLSYITDDYWYESTHGK